MEYYASPFLLTYLSIYQQLTELKPLVLFISMLSTSYTHQYIKKTLKKEICFTCVCCNNIYKLSFSWFIRNSKGIFDFSNNLCLKYASLSLINKI